MKKLMQITNLLNIDVDKLNQLTTCQLLEKISKLWNKL